MNLLDFINNSNIVLLTDGGMGTQLAEAGVEMGGPANIFHPEAVEAVHKKYAECNGDFIITNTFTMNRVSIETHKVGVDVREVNLAGVRLAKKAVREGQYVLGDIGSTGKLFKPMGPLTEEEAYEAFKEQSMILAEGGVDGLIIETMIDLKEAVIALKACKENTNLPVISSMSYNTIRDNNAFTFIGNPVRDCTRTLTEAGADVVGTNCGSLDPFQIADVVTMMKGATSLPIITQPNAGKPRVVDGKDVFDMGTEEFTEGIRKCIEAGAKIVGGCCGTSPAHIKSVARMLGR